MKTLDEDSALGPDMLPTRILKQCAHVLAPVIHKLILAILAIRKWPALWMVHWIVPCSNVNLFIKLGTTEAYISLRKSAKSQNVYLLVFLCRS